MNQVLGVVLNFQGYSMGRTPLKRLRRVSETKDKSLGEPVWTTSVRNRSVYVESVGSTYSGEAFTHGLETKWTGSWRAYRPAWTIL